MQAYQVEFLNPSGRRLTWVVIRDSSETEITPEFLADIIATLKTAHCYRTVNLMSVRHLDRAIVTLGSVEAAISRLQGGFGGGIYRASADDVDEEG